MNFREALKEVYSGKKIALPEWSKYWYVKDGLLFVLTKEGETKETPWFDMYCNRKDWIVVE